MKLRLEHLWERHRHWKEEIGKAGIWDPALFKEVTIRIRPKCKSYNGLFSRKWVSRKGKRILEDRIFIYNNCEDFELKFLDSLLVHEMIHQYIFQTGTKDTRTHGKVFRSFMTRINHAFPEELKINISDHNPSVPLSGPGSTTHSLILSWTDTHYYCCVINPNKIREFDKLVKKYKKTGIVRGYSWASSNDMVFDRYVKCTKTLHGIKKPLSEMKSFCQQYNVVKI